MTYADHNVTEIFMNKSSFLTFIYLSLSLTSNKSLPFIYIFVCLFGCAQSGLQHVVFSSSLTRDQTQAPYIGNTESPWTTREVPFPSLI